MTSTMPYVLRVALQKNANAQVPVVGISVLELEERSRQRALELAGEGWRAGDRVATTDPVEELAAARIGLVLADQASGPSGTPEESVDLTKLEQKLWPGKTLLATKAGPVSHGEFLAALRGAGPSPLWPEEFVALIQQLELARRGVR